MDIELRFVNRSFAGNASEVVVFQKDVVMDFSALPLAWKVIRYCGRDCTHPFTFPQDFEVLLGDPWGNFAPRMQVPLGARVKVVDTPNGGQRLQRVLPAGPSGLVEVVNTLARGAVDVGLCKGGRPLAIKTSIVPGQKALFQPRPVLWIGVAGEIVEGTPIRSAVLSDAATELSLLGVASADIVMTGGGPGPDALPLTFSLENIVPA
jgi:hypothetical protein